MKNLKFTALAVLLLNIGYAQQRTNSEYLREVAIDNAPAITKLMEQEIAKYDLKKSKVFDDSEAAIYQVVFKRGHNESIVNYDDEGEILNSLEKYRNVVIPTYIRRNIAKKYSGWSFIENTYFVKYNFKKGASKSYKIQIANKNLKKTIEFEDYKIPRDNSFAQHSKQK